MLCQLDGDLGNWALPNFLFEIVPIAGVIHLGTAQKQTGLHIHYFVVVVC
jgi:hypothetical protein